MEQQDDMDESVQSYCDSKATFQMQGIGRGL